MNEKYLCIVFLICLPFLSNAVTEFEYAQAKFKLYGDAEINIDGASKKGYVTSINSNDNFDKDIWDISGRILVGLDGHKENNKNVISGFSVQPLLNLDGHVDVDDALIYMGIKDSWKLKIGRYEAYDMFPLGQDTFIEYSGNTANDLYSDKFGYIYMMKEARGRSSSGGAIQLTKNIDKINLELNTMIKEGTTLFDDNSYHGYELQNEKNVVYIRPVLSWKNESFSIAGAVESNMIKNAYGYYDANNKWQDQSNRTGYGLTTSWNSENDWSRAIDGIIINLSAAYLDAAQEKNLTIGTNINWKNFSLGYIYANNNINDFSATDSGIGVGKYHINTVHTSYRFPQVLDIPDFDVYLGAYKSMLTTETNVNDYSHNRYGARLRLKYHF